MSNKNFYKDLLDPGNDNISETSEVGSEDLANIVKGVDDLDDALFGFKPKKQDTQKIKQPSEELRSSERSKPFISKQSHDFPEGDLLADISLSDEDFYDVGNKDPQNTKIRDNIQTKTTQNSTQDKIAKSKKIADLFGLDDEDNVVDSKKKQEGAADWLGIKDSPVKTVSNPPAEEQLGTQCRKKSITESLIAEQLPEVKTSLESRKSDTSFKKTTPDKLVLSKETDVIGQNLKTHISKSEPTRITSIKTGEIFDLLSDKSEIKTSENPRDKKSAILNELFGDTSVNQIKTSRRNSVVKNPDNVNIELTGPSTRDDGSGVLGQYTPSVGAARRPGLGRKRDTSLTPTTPPVSLFLQEDWLASSSQLEVKNEMVQQPKTEVKSANVEVHEILPSWLGGTSVLSDTSFQIKKEVQAIQEQAVNKVIPETALEGKPDSQKPAYTSQVEVEKKTKDTDKQVTETLREMLVKSSDQSQQTALAMQRTEAQLLTALELQTTQSSLSAVCARQRSVLDRQEKQLTQLVTQQLNRQSQMEKQLTEQQERIQNLLEILQMNLVPQTVNAVPHVQPVQEALPEQQNKEVINNFELQIQKTTLENEELRLRMNIMEKHYKMEFESLQMQQRREIEYWEDQVVKQKELTIQLTNEFKERIVRMKENEAELIAQHNERVQRLREERSEDMKQLMEYHKMTMEQMAVLGKLVDSPIRDQQKLALEKWKPLDSSQISEKEEELLRKEKMLSVLQEKLEAQKEDSVKHIEELETTLEQEKLKNGEIERKLKQEQTQLKYKQQQLNQEKKHMEEQYYLQRKMLEEMQEKIMTEQTQLATEKLKMAEEKARLDALAKLQGVSGAASFDVLKAKAEVHGALEAARSAEMQAEEERRQLREKERALDTQRWKLQEREEDLVSRAEHLDRLMQISEVNQEAGQRALEEAKQIEKRAEEKMQVVEKRKSELKERERNLIKVKLEIAQEEIRLNRKREQLEHILPQLSFEEAFTLQPIKDVIDPKMLIMKLRAERELETISKPNHQVENKNPNV